MSHKAKKAQRQQARAEVRGTLRAIMGVLRRDIATKIVAWRKKRRMTLDEALPCHTCAFRAHTDKFPGFERTCIGLMKALIGGRTFYCHDGFATVDGELTPPEDLSQMKSCVGWLWLQAEPAFQPQEHFPLPLLLGMAAFKATDSPYGLGHVTQPSAAILAVDDRAGAVFNALASGQIEPRKAAERIEPGAMDERFAADMLRLHKDSTPA